MKASIPRRPCPASEPGWADGWAVAPDCYRVMVGRSSRDIRLEGVVAQGGALCAAPLAG